MKTTLEMAREAGADTLMYWDIEKLKRFEALVRADERAASVQLTDLEALKVISDEYNAWIRHHAAGHDYDDFLRNRAAHGITEKGD
jgi:hypothetical protein